MHSLLLKKRKPKKVMVTITKPEHKDRPRTADGPTESRVKTKKNIVTTKTRTEPKKKVVIKQARTSKRVKELAVVIEVLDSESNKKFIEHRRKTVKEHQGNDNIVVYVCV